MLPWTLSIAYRRTQQGVLIRFDRAHAVTAGTMVRLATLGAVLALGAWYGGWPGIVVGTCAVTCGVVAEAVFAGLAVRPVRHGALLVAPAVEPPLTMPAWRSLWWLVPMGAVTVWQSYHQGALVHAQRTRAVTESMAVLLVTTATVLGIGVAWRSLPGLGFAALALTTGGVAQIAWLGHRSRPALAQIAARDAA